MTKDIIMADLSYSISVDYWGGIEIEFSDPLEITH